MVSTDLLEVVDGQTAKQTKLDLSDILEQPVSPEGHPMFCSEANTPFDQGQLNQTIVQDAWESINTQQTVKLYYDIINTDRSVGARLSGEIAKRYGNQGMVASPVKLYFEGTAGQSFGVWNAGGVELNLTGDANDYVGKGMAGGKSSLGRMSVPHLNVMKPPLLVIPASTGQLAAIICLRQGRRAFCSKKLRHGRGDRRCG